MKAKQNGSHYYLYISELERIQLYQTPCQAKLIDEPTKKLIDIKIILSAEMGRNDSETFKTDNTLEIKLGFDDYERLAQEPPTRTIFREGNLSYQIDVVNNLAEIV